MIENDTVNADIAFYRYITVWLNYIEPKVDEITYQGCLNYAQNHVIPYFKEEGSTATEMTRKKIQKFIDYLAREGNLKTKKPLSYSSIKKMKTVIKQTLDKAIRDEIITVNPCNLIDMPKNERREPTFLSVDEAKRFLDCIKEEKIYPMILLDIMYGLRRSELMGLKWENIDLENGKIYIRHTIARVNNKAIAKDKTKNQSSKRTICISDETRNLLLKMKAEQETHKKLLGSYYFDSDYVFT